MSDTLVVSGKPSWQRFADFQGPTPEQEREAARLDNIKGKGFKRGQRDVMRGARSVDRNAGQWGCSKGKRW